MASIVAGRGGSWEIRESVATTKGPRSRTLATFKTLTVEVAERACGRATRPITYADLRRAADRAGAPIAGPAADRAARELIAMIGADQRPRPVLSRLLYAALGGDRTGAPSAAALAAAVWIGATPELRALTLHDLLLLVDRLPLPPARARGPRFPVMRSS